MGGRLVLFDEDSVAVLNDHLRRLLNLRGDGVTNGPGGISIKWPPRSKPTETSTSTAHLLSLVSIHDNYLVCALFGETDGNINVAKSPELRKSEYHGRTISGRSYSYTSATARTTTLVSDSSTEDQIINPEYFLPSDVTAGGGAGSAIACAAGVFSVTGDDGSTNLVCSYIEVTQRAWMKDPTLDR